MSFVKKYKLFLWVKKILEHIYNLFISDQNPPPPPSDVLFEWRLHNLVRQRILRRNYVNIYVIQKYVFVAKFINVVIFVIIHDKNQQNQQ